MKKRILLNVSAKRKKQYLRKSSFYTTMAISEPSPRNIALFSELKRVIAYQTTDESIATSVTSQCICLVFKLCNGYFLAIQMIF